MTSDKDRNFLRGLPARGGFFDAESCDVNGDAACDVEDLAVLDRAAAGAGTVVDACEACTSP